MLALQCTFLRDVFEGGAADDPRHTEWPPSWMRLFSALVSVAVPAEDDEVLLALERLPPPEIYASEALHFRRTAFVPTNALLGETRHGTLVARTNSERSWARTAPRSPVVTFVWSDADLEAEHRARLAGLCRRIAYLGRSTSPATVILSNHVVEGEPLVPRGRILAGQRFRYATTVRCPHEGALEALRAAHEAKHGAGEPGDPWAIGRGVEYGQSRPEGKAEAAVLRGPYQSLVIFRLGGSRLDGRHSIRLTYAFRRAVLSHAEEHLPTLHGHQDGDVRQCSFLSLVDVGHRYADGHVIGLAVALPDLPPDHLRVIAAALGGLGKAGFLVAGSLGRRPLERLSPLEARRTTRALDPERWMQPARRWVTATPLVFDRFLKSDADRKQAITRIAAYAGLPAPVEVQLSRRPLVPGGVDMSPQDTLRRPGDRGFRPYTHARLDFGQEVEGPVVLGSMRHYGLGLCIPEKRTNRG